MFLIIVDNILRVKCTDSIEEKRCVTERRGLRYHLLRSAFFWCSLGRWCNFQRSKLLVWRLHCVLLM